MSKRKIVDEEDEKPVQQPRQRQSKTPSTGRFGGVTFGQNDSSSDEEDEGEGDYDTPNNNNNNDLASDDDDEQDDEEEFFEVPVEPQGGISLSNMQPFEIQIPKSTQLDWKATKQKEKEDKYRKQREQQLRKDEADLLKSIHCVHLLCLVAVGMERNTWCNDLELQALMIGLIPSNLSAAFMANTIQLGSNKGKGKASDSSPQLMTHLRMLLPFFTSRFTVNPNLDSEESRGVPYLIATINSMLEASGPQRINQVPLSRESICILFVTVCRALGLRTRLVASLHPAPLVAKKAPLPRKPSAKTKHSSKDTTADYNVEHDDDDTGGDKKKTKLNKKAKTETLTKRKKASEINIAAARTTSGDDSEPSPPKKKSKQTIVKKIAATIREKTSSSAKQEPQPKQTDSAALDDDSDFEDTDPPTSSSKSIPTPSKSKSKTSSNSKNSKVVEVSDDESELDEGPPRKKAVAKIEPLAKKKTIQRREEEVATASDSDCMIIDVKGFPASTVSTKSAIKGRSKSDLDELGPNFLPIQYMAEVFNPHDNEWITLNPLTGKMNEPLEWVNAVGFSKNRQAQVQYVVAFDDAFGIRCVTRRYTSLYLGKTSKLRYKESGQDYLEETLKSFAREWDQTGVVESAKLNAAAVQEPMPTTLSAFNNHPLYALEKHLKSAEVIHPIGKKHAIGTFRNMLVYPRKNVLQCKSPEQWKRDGRDVREGEKPMKLIKARAVTIRKKREIEQYKEAKAQAEERGDDVESIAGVDVSQTPLYAEMQTDWITHPPIVDGKIPKNSFGNFEFFNRRMLPPGAVYLPFKGLSKTAKKLGIDYANAVTGFEFKAGRSFPRVEGVIVAKESAAVLIEAADQEQKIDYEKKAEKRSKKAINNWKKLVRALFIRQRVQTEFGDGHDAVDQGEDVFGGAADEGETIELRNNIAGGFLREADDENIMLEEALGAGGNDEDEEMEW
ncbi:hypothetical protein SmJEL517_g02513 [Synchytrium microbalum]|uniref:Rad4 beta-hairpin domain-containing protein n=1 Tax=Synchytrium microbalum TaxID=1806994 RepID=A0A507C668_9FUNG|nr:uncharacterized protein SmJEL517_g02513 [Synchytrium microbalum]TPX35001.1 hypothetical protein SmJEL517_g02513 [Synchytrium microbalum]